jgi:hypothetical protein
VALNRQKLILCRLLSRVKIKKSYCQDAALSSKQHLENTGLPSNQKTNEKDLKKANNLFLF